MIFPDYKYVDVAVDGAFNRNRLCEKQLLGDPTGRRDTYMTYFRYNQEMIDYFNQNIKQSQNGKLYRSVTGFNGTAYCDWIPIDIDDTNLESAQDETIRMIYSLEGYEVDIQSCRFYFSGSKGFHILIPSEMVGIQPSQDIHKRLRTFIQSITNNIKVDTSIYDKTRLFRLPNTINSKSGLYKVGLYPFEIMNMTSTQILELAKSPREELEVEEDIDINENLQEIYNSYTENKPTTKGSTDGVKTYLCMKKLMEGVGAGQRDNVGVRVASHLKKSGLSKGMMWAALEEWNELNDPPLETYELERVYHQGLGQYEFGCHDPILKSHCDMNCIFYKGDKK